MMNSHAEHEPARSIQAGKTRIPVNLATPLSDDDVIGFTMMLNMWPALVRPYPRNLYTVP